VVYLACMCYKGVVRARFIFFMLSNVLVIFPFRLKLLAVVRRRNLMPSAALAQVFLKRFRESN